MIKHCKLICIISILSIHLINTKESTLKKDELLRRDIEKLKKQIKTAENQIKEINAKLLTMEQKDSTLSHMQEIYRKETHQMISDLHRVLKK
jgi:hypothetical protein